MLSTLRVAAWPAGTARRVLIALAAVFVAVALIGLLARTITPGGDLTIFLASASPYLMLGAVPAILLTVIARSWVFAAVAALALILAAATQAHLYVAATPPPDTESLTVMTANLRLGQASPAAVVAAVRDHDVDLLMTEELTPEEQDALVAAGLTRLMPYRASQPLEGGNGTGLWSRYPLRDITFPEGFTFATVSARVAIPGLSVEPSVVALHMAGPVPYPYAWTRDITHLPSVLDAIPPGRSVIVGGDFNATNDTAQFRQLLGDGYQDAADQAGAGYTRTYPSNRWFPPLLAIDHVLTRDAVATSAETLEIPGSDHRALLVHVAVPRR